MLIRREVAVLILAMTLLACGAEERATEDAESVSAKVPTSQLDGARAEEPAASEGTADEPEGVVGSVSFTIEGVEKTFEHLPAEDNFYSSVNTNIEALPEPGATEKIQINVLYANLKDLDTPAEVPSPEESVAPTTVQQALSRPMVGFHYTNADGATASGTAGVVRIESFGRDGVLAGSFGEVLLPHSDDDLQDLVLEGGSFRVKITSAW